jgi:hypothetical protein
MNNEEVRKATESTYYDKIQFLSNHLDSRRMCMCVCALFRITYATGNDSIEKFNGRKHTTMIFVLK